MGADPEPGPYEPPAGAFSQYFSTTAESARSDLEKFIGENLISKIGIVILVLGVGIGAKYAIDNGWISPLLRVVFGYVMGFGLLGFAVRFKGKYLNFSAVLLSGGMAIMYFVTYFAYSSYALINQPTAFALMVIFTVFTVASALVYDRQVIAHIGLVGAYAVPFLLSNNSGNYLFLFTYMSVINGGILAISIKRYWKPLFFTSSGFTWLIFAVWMGTKYSPEHLYLALTFLAIFFALFYAAAIIQGLKQPAKDYVENLIPTIGTVFIFYCFCLAINASIETNSGHAVLFTYLALASLAVLLTSFRFYGRILIYLCYPFTWLIYARWFTEKYVPGEDFVLAAVFAGVFFAVFYGATLIYRVVTSEIGLEESTALVLTNSFVFYGFGYAVMDSRESLQPYEGLFTVAHAGLHSIVAQAVSRLKPSAVDVVQVLAVLIITFATIAIPVQFDGHTVTLIFSVEAAALFWFGRKAPVPLFEFFSYPVMVLAGLSLIGDWAIAYDDRAAAVSQFSHYPIANSEFITAAVFVAAFAFIYWVNRDKRYESALGQAIVRPVGFIVGTAGLFALYNMFRIEIANYYHWQTVTSGIRSAQGPIPSSTASYYLDWLNAIWQIDYTMFFLTVLSLVNIKKLRSSVLAYATSAFGLLNLIVFLTAGMFLMYLLRVNQPFLMTQNVGAGPMNIWIRYFSYAFAAALIFVFYKYSRDRFFAAVASAKHLKPAFDLIFYGSIFVTASCELVNVMGQFNIADAVKLGLSILWAAYALILIGIGIGRNKKYLRIAAFVLLAATLAKLFLYDIADLATIPKTILFVSIGLLMLVASFLYNKYKDLIFKAAGEAEN